ncbi:MAG: zf-TFIIB domain-containing protein, partial [Acidobacteria bacterium]|nr:zf-TFIIB domain-containing protein [Acidobacteriota bacterium]
CAECEGIWFDAGEWQRIASHHLLESLPEIWTEEYRRRQREEAAEGEVLHWAQERFGDELFSELLSLAARLERHPHRSEVLAFLREGSRAASARVGEGLSRTIKD